MLANVLKELWPTITAPQIQQIADAYSGGARGPLPTGTTKEDFAEEHLRKEVQSLLLQDNSRMQRGNRETFEATVKRDFPA